MNKLLIIIFLYILIISHIMAASFKMSDINTESSLSLHSESHTKEATDSGGNFASLENYPIIKRENKPNYNQFSLKNKENIIEVIIQGSGRTFDDIIIKESIDSNFENISNITVYIDNPIFSTRREIKKNNYLNHSNILKENVETILYTLIDNYIVINNSIFIKISRLGIGENIVYSYKVRSNRSGIYDVSTLFRINGSRWTDLEKRDKIEIRPPEIEVYPEMDKSYAISGESVGISFNVLHKSGWCNDDLDIILYLNETDEYDMYYENGSDYHGEYLYRKLRPLEIERIALQLNYKDAGKHPIPMLHILGATVFQKDREIEVKEGPVSKFVEDYNYIIYIILTLMGIFISYYEMRKHLMITEERVNNRIDRVYINFGRIESSSNNANKSSSNQKSKP
jgi:hypothetical protein